MPDPIIHTRLSQTFPLTDAQVDANFVNLKNGVVTAQATADAAQESTSGQIAAINLADYVALRAYAGNFSSVYVTGYVASDEPSGIAGPFVHSPSDTTSLDNGGTIIVGTDGRRWKRSFSGDISLGWFDAKADGLTDDTSAINQAIIAASDNQCWLRVPAGDYKIVPATPKIDEAGATLCAFPMVNNMMILADSGAIFRIANGISTDANPTRFAMFFSNVPLSNISIVGLAMDMNGQNNPISPNRAIFNFNRFTQAHLCISGTIAGVAAKASNVLIDRCKFLNGSGVSCIVMAQSNTAGVTLGSGWTVTGNTFYNNGLDTDDHSSVFGWATDVQVIGNVFDNPSMINPTTRTGGLVAYEIHGSRTTFSRNKINNYYQGLWISINITEEIVRDIEVVNNTARVAETFCDFYSANLTTGPTIESSIDSVIVESNIIEITNDAVDDQVKAFFKVAARKQPSMVRIANNICKSFDVTKNTVLSLLIVSPNQIRKASQISIQENQVSGISAGLVAYFSGNGGTAQANNISSVTFSNNDLGDLVASPGGLYSNSDVILYGPSTGRIENMRVDSLQTASPINVDSPVGGRATVYGKSLVPIAVSWNSVTSVGNGSMTGKVAIDTDAGHAFISAQLSVGPTTTFDGGLLYPRFTGLVANTSGAICGIINTPSASRQVTGRIDNTGAWATLFSDAGPVTVSTPILIVADSAVTVSGSFPTRSANI